jgi:hypothetical protein
MRRLISSGDQPPTGEPNAGNRPVRFGGRGDLIGRPYPYLAPSVLTSTMPYLATILITLLLSVPAMSAELFRYRDAAKDGTLEYVFDAGEQNFLKRRNERESGRDRRRLHDDILQRTGRSTGSARISDSARSILARLLFGHDQRTDAANVLCRSPAGWDGCCAQSREAVVRRVGAAPQGRPAITHVLLG